MMESCSRAAGSGTRLDHAALKGTLWAVGSCFHATTALIVEVEIFYISSEALCLILYGSYCLSFSVSGFVQMT